MKQGDLVKIKWITFASQRRAKQMGKPVDEPGLVMEEAHNTVKVMFPSKPGEIFTFLKNNLEVLNEAG
tara:strand:+ start:136 stop:339 length:204 start_codon:yes stop_codon:yes gene_type:complete